MGKKNALIRVYIEKLKTLTRTWNCWKCTRYIMQISYYASDFPARQTSRNNKKLIENRFWLRLSIIPIVPRNANINLRYQSKEFHNVYSQVRRNTKRLRVQLARDLTARNMTSCFSATWETHLFPLPQNKNAPKTFLLYIEGSFVEFL